MPAHSKSQQRLFGMVHAYQKGKLKHAPAKVQNVASNISVTDATHFAQTKHKGLRNKVKKAEQFMNKQAFERGFFKAALDNGVEPLLAARLLKSALSIQDLLGGIQHAAGQPNIADVTKYNNTISGGLQDTATGGGLGALGGGALGAAGGYLAGRNKEHPENDHSVRNAILGGLGGGVAGGIGGAGYSFNNANHKLMDVMNQHPELSSLFKGNPPSNVLDASPLTMQQP